MSDRALVVSLHDVSPHTFEACSEIVTALAQIGVNRCSLLVVPDHHQRGHFLANRQFCGWLKELVERGHEAVIHGYYHRRSRREGEGVVAKLTTRVYTADEGEFFDLGRNTAAELVATAREEFRSLGLEPVGFIAPAWLLSDEAEGALRDLRIQYTTRLGSVLNLAQMRQVDSQSLCWSVRSRWRRVVSLGWNRFLFKRLQPNPLLRISVHPVDIQHPAIWDQILGLTQQGLQSRVAQTYEQWVSRSAAQPSASTIKG